LKIWIRQRAGNLVGKSTQRRNLGVDRGVVAIADRRRARLVAGIVVGRANLERHPLHHRDKANGIGGHGSLALPRLVQSPPFPLLERSAERIANHHVVLVAANLFGSGNAETDEVVARNPAFLGIKFCQLDGLGDILVKDDDRGRRERLLGDRERGRQGKTGK
jgi:hypothetical protein